MRKNLVLYSRGIFTIFVQKKKKLLEHRLIKNLIRRLLIVYHKSFLALFLEKKKKSIKFISIFTNIIITVNYFNKKNI